MFGRVAPLGRSAHGRGRRHAALHWQVPGLRLVGLPYLASSRQGGGRGFIPALGKSASFASSGPPRVAKSRAQVTMLVGKRPAQLLRGANHWPRGLAL